MKSRKTIAIFLMLAMILVQTLPICSYAKTSVASPNKATTVKTENLNKSVTLPNKITTIKNGHLNKREKTKKVNKRVITKKSSGFTQKVADRKAKQPTRKATVLKKVIKSKKKSTLINKMTDCLTKVFKWSFKNAIFYGLLTLGIVSFADKVGFVDKKVIFKDIKSTNLEDIEKYIGKGIENTCSIPKCILEINGAFKGQNSSDFCVNKPNKSEIESVTCNFTNFINTLNQQMSSSEQKSFVKKISEVLQQASNSGGDNLLKLWDETRHQRNFMVAGSFAGQVLGGIGSLFGFTNFGFLYGALMGLTLYNYKTDKGALEIIANTFEFADEQIAYFKSLTSSISNLMPCNDNLTAA
ncbi:MAG: hypothetical protein RUMPE_00553 [Eubacteriales bacterium SKADARSKE-1]|nr:hypothetical protein [Eubacteriales bacterium SKADARSKE-1]